MTLIAQITDLHLREDGANPCHDPARAMHRAFSSLAALDQRPEAIVLTGDILDRSARSYDTAVALLRQSPVPLLPMPGNHDRPAVFRAAFAGWAPFHPDHLSFVQPVGALGLIALDSTLPDGSGGLDDARLDWLALVLAGLQTPAILALHHPPFATGAPHLDTPGFQGADRLAALIAGSPVRRIIAGHSHRAIQTLWAGVISSTCGAIGHGLSLSLTGASAHAPRCASPSLELHLLRDGTLVSHQMDLGGPSS